MRSTLRQRLSTTTPSTSDLGAWRDREWIASIGIALSLSREDFNPAKWVEEQCGRLPLSVWDAEENHEGFRVADRVAQLRFLVALHVVHPQNDLGRTVDPALVRVFAEKLWGHCSFVRQHLTHESAGGDASEYAARAAVEWGEPSDEWILNQARSKIVDPRTLWGLIDQRLSKGELEEGEYTEFDDKAFAELRRVTANRFGGGRPTSLVELYYLAQLWLVLGEADEAENTATAILAFDKLDRQERTYRVLALKLLALSASKRRLAQVPVSEIKSIYGQLWSNHTPTDEREDRQQVDDLLKLPPHT